MGRPSLTSEHRVSLTLDGDSLDLERLVTRPGHRVPAGRLWGTGQTGSLPERRRAPSERCRTAPSSPAPRYGNSTGYITEQTFAFDPLYPLGLMPLEDGEPPGGPVPARPPATP